MTIFFTRTGFHYYNFFYRGRPQDPGKPNKKGVLQFQPVVQPPNTATVVFPSLGSNNLGELEIVNRNVATPTVAASGDGNNNSQKNTGSDDWDGWDSARSDH